MAVNWSEPKVEKEKVIIEPEVFIEDARRYTKAGDFNMAERAYANALTNSRGRSNAASIAQTVKEGLSEIYILWADYCMSNREFSNAEISLRKLCKVECNETIINEQYYKLYTEWCKCLFADGNKRAYIAIGIKKLKLGKVLGKDSYKDGTIALLIDCLIATNRSEDRQLATQLHLCSRFIRFIVLAVASAVCWLAIVAPMVTGEDVYELILYMSYPLWIGLLVKYSKHVDKVSVIVLRVLSLFVVPPVFALLVGALLREHYVILFLVDVILSICLLKIGIELLHALASYVSSDPVVVIETFEKNHMIKCRSCREKIKISYETVEEVVCPKCSAVNLEPIELRIKNKSQTQVSAYTKEENIEKKVTEREYDPSYGWKKAGAIAGRIIVHQIIKNLRF